MPNAGDRAADLVSVQAALRGEEAARLALVDRLGDLPAMIRIKNLRLGSPLRPHELEDVVQNVLLSLWQKLPNYDGRVPLLHWAYGFGVVEIRRAVERRSRRREQPSPAEDQAAPAVDYPHEAARDLLRRCLADLDPHEREVVHHKHFEGLTFDQIASRLGIVANTAKTRYYRALERLRARLHPLQDKES